MEKSKHPGKYEEDMAIHGNRDNGGDDLCKGTNQGKVLKAFKGPGFYHDYPEKAPEQIAPTFPSDWNMEGHEENEGGYNG